MQAQKEGMRRRDGQIRRIRNVTQKQTKALGQPEAARPETSQRGQEQPSRVEQRKAEQT